RRGCPDLARLGGRGVQRGKKRAIGVQPNREGEEKRAFSKVQGRCQGRRAGTGLRSGGDRGVGGAGGLPPSGRERAAWWGGVRRASPECEALAECEQGVGHKSKDLPVRESERVSA